MSAARTLRCAIYTRVSSDQGLKQDFNSLDAQREAAEAYSRARRTKAGACAATQRIDVIVVYKVDRLTRSLADFAKLVELFDSKSVSSSR